MPRAPTPALLILIALASVRPICAEDIVRFKNGRRLSGQIVAETAADVTIELFAGGRMTVPRSMIAEILRDVGAGEGSAESGTVRAEHFFLWSGERRLGTRSLYLRKLEDGGLLLEEDSIFTDEDGKEDARIRLVEKANADLSPREIVYRETSGEGVFLLRGAVRDGMLDLTVSFPGTRRSSSLELPAGHRFPLAAREMAVRKREALAEGLEVRVFDPRVESFVRYRFSGGSTRRSEWDGAAVEVSVLVRRRGQAAPEETWIDAAGRCLTEELNGPDLIAVLSTRKRIEAFREGGEVGPSEEETRVRPLVVEPDAGFSLRKPTISWKAERKARGGEMVLSLSNIGAFAYVDVFVFASAPEGGGLDVLARDIERRFSGASVGFKRVATSISELGREKAVILEVTSTTKGEKLRSLLVGAVHRGKTWVLAMACPEAYFARTRPEFEAMLKSFLFLD